MTEKDHPSIRWNPDLQEWFCPKCGITSDHVMEQDAIAEMAAFDCSLHGTHYLTKQKKQKQKE
jgi:hypothetical protein